MMALNVIWRSTRVSARVFGRVERSSTAQGQKSRLDVIALPSRLKKQKEELLVGRDQMDST